MTCSNRSCDFWQEAEENCCRIVVYPGPKSCNNFAGEDAAPQDEPEK